MKMIKFQIILIFFAFLYPNKTLLAQDTPDEYQERINYIFANVDPSKVTTGLLSDYGLQIIPPEYYDGVLRDSNEIDINAFRTLYAGMDNSRFNSTCQLPSQDTVFNAISQSITESGQAIPIASMCIEYNCFRDDAYTAGLVTVTNDQIFDYSMWQAKTRTNRKNFLHQPRCRMYFQTQLFNSLLSRNCTIPI